MDSKSKIISREVIVQRVILGYAFFWCIIMAVFIYIWLPYMGSLPIAFISVSSTLLLLMLYMAYRIHYRLTIAIIPVYIVILTLGIYPLLAMEWQLGHISAYIWYLTAPLKISTIYPRRTTQYWCLYLLVLILSSFFTASLFPPLLSEGKAADPDIQKLLQQTLQKSDIWTIFVSLIDVVYFLYFRDKLCCLLRPCKQILFQDKRTKSPSPEILYNETKYDALYADIIDYFELEQPYRRTDFNISKLAVALHTNVTYISKAIQHCTGMNYALFINTCRIRYIKEVLMSNSGKFTLRHIYLSSGFMNQSTFNRTFKNIEGMTPSEFCRKMNVILPDENEYKEEEEEDEEDDLMQNQTDRSY